LIGFVFPASGSVDSAKRTVILWDLPLRNEAGIGHVKPWRRLPAWLAGEPDLDEWELARVIHGSDRIDCLVRPDGPTYRILSYAPLPATADLCLRFAHGDMVEPLQVTGYRQYEMDGGFVHIAALATQALNIDGFHREPAWAHG